MFKDYSRRFFWLAVAKAAKSSPWLVTLILLGISFILVVYFEVQSAKEVFLTISKGTWLSVVGSFLASALFLFFHNFLAILQQTKDEVPLEYFAKVHDKFGLKNIYPQRGGDQIQSLYKELLSTATKKVWAIGMTNNSFLEQHANLLLDRCRNAPNLEVKVAFWNPNTTLTVNGQNYCIYDIQSQLEEKTSSATNWVSKMDARLSGFATRIGSPPSLRSTFKIYTLSLVTNASCFVIDDDVFFFPFLARSNSNLDPHMHFSASTGLGKLIVEHYTYILQSKTFCEEYESLMD